MIRPDYVVIIIIIIIVIIIGCGSCSISKAAPIPAVWWPWRLGFIRWHCNICGFQQQNLLRVILPAPRILIWFVGFRKICVSLIININARRNDGKSGNDVWFAIGDIQDVKSFKELGNTTVPVILF